MKRLLCVAVFALLMACGTDSIFKQATQPMTSPALTEQEAAAVQMSRLAHGTIREAAAAYQIAYQYIGRKGQPCVNVKSAKCAEIKRQLMEKQMQVEHYEREVDRMRQLAAMGDLLNSRTGAEGLRNALISIQTDINAVQ